MTPEQFLIETPIFTTKQFAVATDLRLESASRSLMKYVQNGLLKKVTRGLWANEKHRHFSRYGLVPFLLGPEQGYISFLSALHRHDVISQVPQSILIATTGHTRRLDSEFGKFEFIQIKPQLMKVGIQWFDGEVQYGLASLEKALLDCLYISSRKGKRFSHFPELNFENFSQKKFDRLLKEHPIAHPIKIVISKRLNKLRI